MAKTNPMRGVDPTLAKLGFGRINPVRRRCMSMGVSGKTKSGKTRLGLTMPQPIGILNFDRSLRDILPEFPDVDVIVKDFSDDLSPGEELSQVAAKALEAEFAKAYYALLEHKHVKSIVVDKGTTLYEVVRYAELGKASARPHHFVPINMRMRGYLLAYQKHEKNTLFLQDLKEEWVDEKPTGRLITDGFKYTDGLLQTNALMWRETEDPFTFKMRIDGCGLNADLVGWEFEDDKVSWAEIAVMVTPDTKRSDWK